MRNSQSRPDGSRLRVMMTLIAASTLALALTAPSYARPLLRGHAGGGNVGTHFSASTVHVHTNAHRPPPPPPRPHPVPPGPRPHPPGPPPRPPVPRPYPPGPPHGWWIPGAAVWGAAIADDVWDHYSDHVVYVLPNTCAIVYVHSVKYAECGSHWYQMVYHGSQIAYIEVPNPS